MKCLHCGQEIPERFFQELENTQAAKTGRFNCPHCAADHVRRKIGLLPSGQPEYTMRLWGHPTKFRKRQEGDSQ